MSYTRECIEKYGGIIFRNNFDNKGNNIITISLECMDSEDNLNKYYYNIYMLKRGTMMLDVEILKK